MADTDRETNLHPKNNPNINLKPNIVTGNIPDKAVAFKQLDENIRNKIDSQSFQIAKNTADISSLRNEIDDEASARESGDSRIREEVFEYVDNINSNLEEKISTNENAISSLETRTKNLEDSKVNVNTGTFDPTSDNPASQKSIAGAMEKLDQSLQEKISANKTDIAKNTADIANLESRTKNLEDTKVNVNTGTFDPTSDNPASQKSIYTAIQTAINSAILTALNTAV